MTGRDSLTRAERFDVAVLAHDESHQEWILHYENCADCQACETCQEGDWLHRTLEAAWNKVKWVMGRVL